MDDARQSNPFFCPEYQHSHSPSESYFNDKGHVDVIVVLNYEKQATANRENSKLRIEEHHGVP